MSFDLKGQYALVTGASDGIGRAIAMQLAAQDAEVYITTTGEVPAWIKSFNNVTHLVSDFTKEHDVINLLTHIAALPRLDILVNNAGILIPSLIDDVKLEDWRRVMTVNTEVPMRLTQEAVKKMRVNHYGRIVMVSSIAALVNRKGADSYAASKAALLGLTRACAMDVAQDNILVNALCPGHTQTPMMDKLLSNDQQEALRQPIPMGRFGTPQEIANMVLFLVSPTNTYMTAQTVIVDGGVSIQ